jgi:hypothetical protein
MLVRDVTTHSLEMDVGPIDEHYYVTFYFKLEVSKISESKIVFWVTIQASEELDDFEYSEIRRAYLEDFAVWYATHEVARHFGREAGSFEGVYNNAEGTVVVTPYVGNEF